MGQIDKKKYFKELKKIENEYYFLISHFDTNFPKPLNLQEEKEIFFKAIADDKIYNPKIKYQKKEFDEEIFNKLKKLTIDTENDLYGFKKLYCSRLKAKIAEINCHKTWGKPISTNYVIQYRGKPSWFLLRQAKKFCSNYKRQKVRFKILTHKEIAKDLRKEVNYLTGDKIKIKYIDMQSKINIAPIQKLININPNVRFTTLDLERLKVHEIGVHYMRYYNGNNSGIKILESGTSNYIETEEGLAAYSEELKGLSSSAVMYIYAGRVIATYYTLKNSFYTVFKILKSFGFKDEDAFAITYRAKRNLKDTSQKGGFTKDYVYFKGYKNIKKYVKHHDIKDLFIGKIKIEDRKLLKKYIKEHKAEIKTIFD